MPIISLNETKSILQLSDTTYDFEIARLIPIVQGYVVDYTHNQFLSDLSVYTSSIAFVNGSPPTITDEDETFLTNYLLNSKDILVQGSLYNDGFYKTHPSTAITAGTITLDNDEELYTEDESQSVKIIKVVFPDGIKDIAARMIGYKLSKNVDSGVKSESIGDYSVTFDNVGSYPPSLLDGLKTYRKLFS